MNPRVVRYLTALYPPSWRRRYQREFEIFLQAHPSNLKNILNVARWALLERFFSLGEIPMDARQNSLTLMTFSGLAAFAAGLNFYWTVDDTPLATAIRNHGPLFASWTLVQVGALALALAALLSSRVFLNMARQAFANRRRDVLLRLAVPFFAAAVVLAWLVSVPILGHTHWVPTPWDVAGDWTAPANWPSPAARWALSSVSFALMIAGLLAAAISIRQAVLRTALSNHQRSSFSLPSLLLVASVAAMTIGLLSWGWFVQRYAPADFYARNGGLFSSANFVSWLASCVVLLAAAVMAVKSARSAFSLATEQPNA